MMNETVKFCPYPESVENGFRLRSNIRKLGANKYLGDYEVACYENFILSGDPIVRCVNGAWTPSPVCIKGPSCSLDIIYTPALNVRILSTNLIYNDEGTGDFEFDKVRFSKMIKKDLIDF
jgi:hypothetical protein